MPSLKEVLARKARELFTSEVEDLVPVPLTVDVPEAGPRQLYQPLDEHSNTTRLMCIHPSSEYDATIDCTLYTARLDDGPQFTALSYVWGDPQVTETIRVNGHPLEVTTNLATALRHIRATSVRSILDAFWADGICIDQQNLRERRHQVSLMGHLYSKAALVCSWIGLDSHRCCEVLEAFHELDPYPTFFRLLEKGTENGSKAQGFQQWLTKILTQWPPPNEDSTDESTIDFIDALALLGGRDIFKRAWVFQEATLANSAVYICGNVAIDAFGLYSAVEQIFRLAPTIEWPPDILEYERDELCGSIPCLGKVRDVYNTCRAVQQQPLKLSYCLHTTSLLQVTDPRDKVYSVLGLSEVNLPISYQDSITTTYLEATRYMIFEELALDCLAMAGANRLVGIKRTEPSLPSWVPDFHAISLAPEICVPTPRKMRFPASLDRTVNPSNDRLSLHCGAILVPTGKAVSTITLDQTNDGIEAFTAALQTYLADMRAHSHLQPGGAPHLQRLCWLLYYSGNGGGPLIHEKLGELKSGTELLIHVGIRFYSSFWEPLMSRYIRVASKHHRGPKEPDLLALFKDVFHRDFWGRDEPIPWPSEEELQGSLLIADTGDPYVCHFFQVRSVLSTVSVFGTSNGFHGLCEFPPTQEDVFVVVPGCSYVLVMRKVEDYYVLRGPCIVGNYTAQQALDDFETGKVSVERVVLR